MSIVPILLDSGDPKLCASLDVDVIAGDPLLPLKGAPVKVEAAASLGRPNPTDPSGPAVALVGLELDIHDSLVVSHAQQAYTDSTNPAVHGQNGYR
jgi:hypothetical protein